MKLFQSYRCRIENQHLILDNILQKLKRKSIIEDYNVVAGCKIKLRNTGGSDRKKNKTLSTKQSLLVQGPYLSLWKRRMTCRQGEKSFNKTNIGSIELGVLLKDSDKTIKFLQESSLIPNDTRKDCKFCGMQNSAALHKKTKKTIPYIILMYS